MAIEAFKKKPCNGLCAGRACRIRGVRIRSKQSVRRSDKRVATRDIPGGRPPGHIAKKVDAVKEAPARALEARRRAKMQAAKERAAAYRKQLRAKYRHFDKPNRK
jgi:hypothetical protein